MIRSIAIVFAATGGTSFRNADLTDANFTEATLKSTDFRTANLTRTCFRNTEKLDRARVGNSILADTRVRELLITGNGYKKSYLDANLQGANLIGVNLNEANLKQANLNEATLYQANLESANLTETQALGTDFTAVSFTGACLEAWNIDGNTKLDRVDCRFVYLLEYPKPGTGDRERRPHHINKCFEPGDFEKLYKKILTTVQFLLKDGLNPEAFTAAFQNLANPSTVPQPSNPIINIHAQSKAENKVASDNIDQSRKAEISGGTVNATGAGSLSLGDNGGTTANTIEQLPDPAVSAALEEDRPS